MPATTTRAAEQTAVATVVRQATPTCCPGQPPPIGAPSPYTPSTGGIRGADGPANPTMNPTAASLATSVAVRASATRLSERVYACDWLRRVYADHGQVFVPRADQEALFYELLAVNGITTQQQMNGMLGQMLETTGRKYIADCVGP